MEGTKTADVNVGQEKASEKGESIHYIEFDKPYHFEGKEYRGVELEGAWELTTKEKISIDRMYERLEEERPANPILSTLYAVCVATHVTKLPLEFFYKMRASDFLKVETAVRRAFFMPD